MAVFAANLLILIFALALIRELRIPLLIGYASLDELAIPSGQVWECVLQQRAVRVVVELFLRDRKVESAGDIGQD